MGRTSNFPICSLSPCSCRGPIPTLAQLAACLPLGQSFGAGTLWWVANHCQEEAGEVSGGRSAPGCWAVVLVCSCHRVAAGTACGDLVWVSQSPWKRKTFPVCNSVWTAHSHALHHAEGTRLKGGMKGLVVNLHELF